MNNAGGHMVILAGAGLAAAFLSTYMLAAKPSDPSAAELIVGGDLLQTILEAIRQTRDFVPLAGVTPGVERLHGGDVARNTHARCATHQDHRDDPDQARDANHTRKRPALE